MVLLDYIVEILDAPELAVTGKDFLLNRRCACLGAGDVLVRAAGERQSEVVRPHDLLKEPFCSGNITLCASISKEGDRLFFLGEFGGKSELIPKAEHEFVHRRLPMRFTFVKDGAGRVTHLIRRNSLSPDVRAIDMKARKIE